MSKDRALLCLKRKDQETGLHYNRYRYYSPYVGRFISKDPIGLLGGNNVYAYTLNPTRWVDTLGLKDEWVTNWEAKYGKLPTDYQVHHIIPKGAKSEKIFKELCPNFDVHSASNLIALPRYSTTPVKNGPGFGKAIHNGGHGRYSAAVNYAMKGAIKLKLPMKGCQKLAAIQAAFKNELEKGTTALYGENAKTDWIAIMRKYVRG